jgi:hypothetical protein
LGDKHPLKIPPGCAAYCVVVPDEEDKEDNKECIPMRPACQVGFDLIHNGNHVLFHFETEDTEDGEIIPLKECCIPQHFQDILKPQNWGFCAFKGTLFDPEHWLYMVTGIFDDNIEAKLLFMDGLNVSSFHTKN